MHTDVVPDEVVVITGAGGMGLAIARRLGTGRHVVLADVIERALGDATRMLKGEGHQVHPVVTDVSDPGAVASLAAVAAGLGRIRTIVHTAGVSPVQASPDRIVLVDVIGTALLLDAFLPYAQAGTVAICIASMAGTMASLPAEDERGLATTPTAELASLSILDPATMNPGSAYGIAKRANQLRVRAAAIAWGRRGARVVSISPGIIVLPPRSMTLVFGPFSFITSSR